MSKQTPQRPTGTAPPPPTGDGETQPQTPMDGRPEQRPVRQREMNSIERAAARAAELMDGGALDSDSSDKFYFDPALIPDGWTYEWKRHTTLNKEDPAYEVELKRMGWEPVPAGRHPELMPVNWKGKTIEREGMILMERPAIITQRVHDRDRKNAKEQVVASERKLQEAPPDHFERVDQNRESAVKIKHTMEPIDIPED